MRTTIPLLVFIIPFLMSAQDQDFLVQFYFEDAMGRRDTLTMVDPFTGSFPDIQDIQSEPLEPLDVRFILYRRSDQYADPLWDCDHISGEVDLDDSNLFGRLDYESKVYNQRAQNCTEGFFAILEREFFIPLDSDFPITVNWDQTLFQEECRSDAFISELPREEYLIQNFTWCEEQIENPLVSLRDSNSVVLSEPNFITLEREDNSIVAVYYISIADINRPIIDSVSDLVLKQNFIHPNPTKDKLYLDTPNQDWQYQIYNPQGQKMIQGDCQGYIDVATLPSGIYFLQLQKENELYQAIKFVKE